MLALDGLIPKMVYPSLFFRSECSSPAALITYVLQLNMSDDVPWFAPVNVSVKLFLISSSEMIMFSPMKSPSGVDWIGRYSNEEGTAELGDVS